MQVFHFFGWLWIMNFIIALGQCVLAGAFASWYFAFHKPDVSAHICVYPFILLLIVKVLSKRESTFSKLLTRKSLKKMLIFFYFHAEIITCTLSVQHPLI